MTDRELLDLAAKAAGVDLYVEWDIAGPTGRYRNGPDGDTWAPLDDDGDAFRLAVQLRIGIQSHQKRGDYALADDGDGNVCCIAFDTGDDPRVSMRRAVVRVAANIGAKMP